MLLRARILLPISNPPVADGGVLISGGRVVALGRWRDLSRHHAEPSVDLGEIILMPGLVNAHCHLDYTDMGGQPAPKQFSDWIKGLLARKAAASYADYAQAWLRGAAMLARTGVTTVADIEAVPELLPEVWSSTPLRVASFLEMTGVRSGRNPEAILQEAAAKIASLRPARGFAGLSPTPCIRPVPNCCAPALNWPQEIAGGSRCMWRSPRTNLTCTRMAGDISSIGSKASATCRTAATERPLNKSAVAA